MIANAVMLRPRASSRTARIGSGLPPVRRWLAGLLAVLFAVGPAWGLPHGAVVVSGNATVSQTGPRTLQIVQHGGPTVIQWRSFSIGTGELVRFLQPGQASLAVNRVAGGNASVILGQLLANGRIVLINPAGITVGAGGLIRVAGLVANDARAPGCGPPDRAPFPRARAGPARDDPEPGHDRGGPGRYRRAGGAGGHQPGHDHCGAR